jgi:putative chitinase
MSIELLTTRFLRGAMPGMRRPEEWLHPLIVACHRYGITTPRRMAAFFAQAGHESADCNRLRESLNYSPERLLRIFPKRVTPDQAERLGRIESMDQLADQPAIAELVYGMRPDLGNVLRGDGAAFIGVGIFQITGRYNHTVTADEFRMDVEDVAEWCQSPEGASLAAAHYWHSRDLSILADRGRYDEICCRVNGAPTAARVNGIADRRARLARALALLERAEIPA